MIKGVNPNIVTYNSLTNGYFLVNEVNTAKDVFNTVARRGVTSDLHSYYSIMINALCKAKMVDEAVSLFKDTDSINMIPDTVTYSSLIDGLCKSRRISYVVDLIDEMHARGQPANVVTYNSVLDALCKNHEVEIKEQGIQPDMVTYNVLIDGLYYCGRLKNAQEIFQDLLIKGYHLETISYTVMIKGLCKDDLFDEALALLSKMEDNGCIPNALTYETIIYALFEKNENYKAKKLVREMIARGPL